MTPSKYWDRLDQCAAGAAPAVGPRNHGILASSAWLHQPDRGALATSEPADPTRIQRFEWKGCKGGGPVLLHKVVGGGHQPPSFTPNSEAEGSLFGPARAGHGNGGGNLAGFFRSSNPRASPDPNTDQGRRLCGRGSRHDVVTAVDEEGAAGHRLGAVADQEAGQGAAIVDADQLMLRGAGGGLFQHLIETVDARGGAGAQGAGRNGMHADALVAKVGGPYI